MDGAACVEVILHYEPDANIAIFVEFYYVKPVYFQKPAEVKVDSDQMRIADFDLYRSVPPLISGPGFQLYPGPTSLYVCQYRVKKEEMFVKVALERYNRKK